MPPPRTDLAPRIDLTLTRRLVLRLLEWEATAVTNSPDDDSADAELKQLLRAALAAGDS